MNSRLRTTFHILIAITAFVAIKTAVSYTALSSFSIMFIEAEFDHDDVVDVYFGSTEKVGFREKFKKRSESFVGGIKSSNRVELNNHVIRKLRVDTGTKAGQIKLYSIKMISHFGPGIELDHQAIYENFSANRAIGAFRLKKDHVLIIIDGEDPFITYNGELVQRNFFLEILLPLIFGLFCYLACGRFSYQSIHAFNDIGAKRSSTGLNFGSLDGVRGLAALLVLAQHSGLTRTGGIFGVWLFFCLSGFLLSSPFVRQPALAISRPYMTSYLFRRIKRIVPMYYVMITITFLFAGKTVAAIRHYLFLQADGHFWSISQEMFFYLLLPLVMASSYLICRNRGLLHVVFLSLCALASHRLLSTDMVTLYGNNADLKPMAGIFLTGVAAAFAYNFLTSRFVSALQLPLSATLFSFTGLLVLGTCLFMSAHPFEHLAHFNPLQSPGIFGLGAGLFILATLLARNSILDKTMNLLPLKAVGIVGYSFYLVHPKIIDCVRSATDYFGNYYPTGIMLFMLAGVAAYLVSIFTYSYIERPFISK